MKWLYPLLGSNIPDHNAQNDHNTHTFKTDPLDKPICPEINPANGLPMINCSIDIHGNPYGTDLNDYQDYDHGLDHDDSYLFDNDYDDDLLNNSWED